MKEMHELFTRVLKQSNKGNTAASGNAVADQRKTAGEDMAIKEVEKKQMKEILLKLMRLSYIQNLETVDEKREIEYKQLL